MIGELALFAALCALVGAVGVAVGILLGRRLDRVIERPGEADQGEAVASGTTTASPATAQEAEPR